MSKRFPGVILFLLIIFAYPFSGFGQNFFYHLLGLPTLPPFTWTGVVGDNNWNTAGNWSDNIVPGAGDIAKFKGGACSAANCNVNVNINVSVAGIDMDAAYAGTITQLTTRTISIGASGWQQAGGTFTGGDAAISLNGPSNFSAGIFTSTSATLSVDGNYSLGAGLTFNHNNGTFFTGPSATRSFSFNNQSLYKFTYGGGCLSNINMTGTFKVLNLLSMDNNACPQFNGGTIESYGDITTTVTGMSGSVSLVLKGSSNQTITGTTSISLPSMTIASTGGNVIFSGTLNFLGHFIYQSGTVVTTGSTVIFAGLSTAVTIDPQSINFNDVIFNGGSTANMTLPSPVNVYGTLTMNTINSGLINGAAINAYANIVDGSSNGWSGSSILNIVGSGNQSITSIASTHSLNLVNINSSGGTVTFAGAFNLNNTFSYTAGTVVATAADFCLCSWGTTTYNIPFQINNLSLTGGSVTAYTLTSSITALGNLTLSNINNGSLSGGSLIIYGNVISNAGAGFSGTTSLQLMGTAASTVTIGAGAKLLGGSYTDNKNALATTITQASAVSLAGAGQSMSITTGTHNMAGFSLGVNGTLTIGASGKLVCGGGTPTYGTLVLNGQILCGPTIGITWTGLAGDNLWNTAGNWTNNTVPGASDIAYFNSYCSGANCDVTVNVNPNVKGIVMNSNYTGTITQS